MPKKIRTFTVDEKVYSELIAMFKRYKADVSLSLFVSNSLQELLNRLKNAERAIKQSPEYGVPMSFIINETVKSRGGGIEETREFTVPRDPSLPSDEEVLLMDWRDEYEAYQHKLPVEFYVWLRDGNYSLSPNGKYLVEKETGRKFLPVSKTQLVGIREEKE